ncbi:MAG: hypothetical protein H7X92_10295 [Chitinophagales bacterium]|nr:hypothetical protein [Hyphomicrobiales bacterium]
MASFNPVLVFGLLANASEGNYSRLMTDLPENVDLRFLATMMQRMDVRLDSIDIRLHGLDKRMDGLEVRMDGLEVRMSTLETAVTRLADISSKTIDAVVQLGKSMDQIKETSTII